MSDDALRAWASTRLAFVSSEMQALRRERRAVADALRKLGLDVVMFEDLGGRDDDAQTAYLDGVARSDIRGSDVSLVDQHILETEQPFLVIGTAEVNIGRQCLPIKA